jgi:hypothetical protein
MVELKGTYECRVCHNIWDGSETYINSQSLGANVPICGNPFCGADVIKVSDLPKSEYKSKLKLDEPKL